MNVLLVNSDENRHGGGDTVIHRLLRGFAPLILA
jgi:hypothetical protein